MCVSTVWTKVFIHNTNTFIACNMKEKMLYEYFVFVHIIQILYSRWVSQKRRRLKNVTIFNKIIEVLVYLWLWAKNETPDYIFSSNNNDRRKEEAKNIIYKTFSACLLNFDKWKHTKNTEYYFYYCIPPHCLLLNFHLRIFHFSASLRLIHFT